VSCAENFLADVRMGYGRIAIGRMRVFGNDLVHLAHIPLASIDKPQANLELAQIDILKRDGFRDR
jgi:hypothetical protein